MTLFLAAYVGKRRSGRRLICRTSPRSRRGREDGEAVVLHSSSRITCRHESVVSGCAGSCGFLRVTASSSGVAVASRSRTMATRPSEPRVPRRTTRPSRPRPCEVPKTDRVEGLLDLEDPPPQPHVRGVDQVPSVCANDHSPATEMSTVPAGIAAARSRVAAQVRSSVAQAARRPSGSLARRSARPGRRGRARLDERDHVATMTPKNSPSRPRRVGVGPRHSTPRSRCRTGRTRRSGRHQGRAGRTPPSAGRRTG